jgi:hypothetical protein
MADMKVMRLTLICVVFALIPLAGSACSGNRRPLAPSMATQILRPSSDPSTTVYLPFISGRPLLTGLYESCLPTDADCYARLTEMRAKGFNIVLNDGLRYADTADSLRAYADHAYNLGMKIILPVKYRPEWDNDEAFLPKKFANLAEECGCTNNQSFLTYYINTLKHHPALWGYYMADEVHSEHHDGLKIYSDLVKTLDPDHPRLIVEEGTNDPMELFFAFHADMSDTTDVIAADNYPYGYIDTYSALTRYTGESARMTQYWAEKLHLKSAMVLQAFSWTQDPDVTPLCNPWPACAPFPSYEQMKAQRDQTWLYSKPELILWFYYSHILDSDNPAQHWSDLAAAASDPLPGHLPSPTPRPQNCPSEWTCEDIGSPKLEGTQALTGRVWTVEGSGWDIWSSMWEKADQFRYAWQNLTADGEISARMVSQTNTNSSAKAGIMLRKTFDPVSPYYGVFVTPGIGIHVQYRPDFNENPTDLASVSETPPVYLKIVRTGTTYSAYTSADGVDWTLIPDSVINVGSLDGSLMAGLAVTSRNESAMSIAMFDNVIVRVNQ